MMDVDHFNAYNDTHGHQAGDRLLREAVSSWTDQLGTAVARYGGEEFAVPFPASLFRKPKGVSTSCAISLHTERPSRPE